MIALWNKCFYGTQMDQWLKCPQENSHSCLKAGKSPPLFHYLYIIFSISSSKANRKIEPVSLRLSRVFYVQIQLYCSFTKMYSILLSKYICIHSLENLRIYNGPWGKKLASVFRSNGMTNWKMRFLHKICFVASYNVIFANIVTIYHGLVLELKIYIWFLSTLLPNSLENAADTISKSCSQYITFSLSSLV